MVLVDTSVWIRSLAGRPPYVHELGRLLAADQVVGHDLVYGELLIGDSGGRQKLLTTYERIPYAATISHSELIDFVRARKLNGRGAGWIDVHLLAATVLGNLDFWTADTALATMAAEIGVAYPRQYADRIM